MVSLLFYELLAADDCWTVRSHVTSLVGSTPNSMPPGSKSSISPSYWTNDEAFSKLPVLPNWTAGCVAAHTLGVYHRSPLNLEEIEREGISVIVEYPPKGYRRRPLHSFARHWLALGLFGYVFRRYRAGKPLRAEAKAPRPTSEKRRCPKYGGNQQGRPRVTPGHSGVSAGYELRYNHHGAPLRQAANPPRLGRYGWRAPRGQHRASPPEVQERRARPQRDA